MTGIFWLNIDGTTPLLHDLLLDVTIMDPEALFQTAFTQDNCPDTTSLSIFRLSDLNLPHGSTTLDIYKAAGKRGIKTPTPGAVLRIFMQHPNIFRSTVINERRVESCLIGIDPILAPSGKKYILELGEYANKPFLRFRRADDPIRWADSEYWVSAT